MYPTGFPMLWFASTSRLDHRGATALVPPIVICFPSTTTSYPVSGEASPETSGTPRPVLAPGLAEGGTPAAACQDGKGKSALTPPPVAPPLGKSSHTTWLV